MKAIVFDVDDTIYDQQVVFDQACRDVFGELKGVSLVDLFKANRYYSDESFDAMGRGEMTKEEIDASLHSWKSHAELGNTYKLLQRIDAYYANLWKEIKV